MTRLGASFVQVVTPSGVAKAFHLSVGVVDLQGEFKIFCCFQVLPASLDFPPMMNSRLLAELRKIGNCKS